MTQFTAGVPAVEHAELLEQVASVKELAFTQLRDLVRGSISLRVCGFKTLEDATTSIINRACKDIERKTTALEQKYPDI